MAHDHRPAAFHSAASSPEPRSSESSRRTLAVAAVIAWFAILFTGRDPRGLFDFVLGVFRWTNRTVGCAFILVIDAYPPFRLQP